MKLAGGLLLLAAAIPVSVSAAPAPSESDRVIYAMLDHYGRDIPSNERDCVRPTLDRLGSVSRKDRDIWGPWWTPDEKPLARASAREIDRVLLRAAPPSAAQRIGRVTSVPKSLILSAEDEPATGPCALASEEAAVWHVMITHPIFNGDWAFVEIATLGGGSPPPQLWALKRDRGKWQPKYFAMRTLWYD